MKLKVISFNIRNHNDKNGHSIAERAPRLKKVISHYSPDLIGLQEYNELWKPYFEDVANSNYDILNVDRGDGESSPMLWRKDRFDVVKIGHFWFGDNPDIPSRDWDEIYHCPRICAYAVLKDKQTGTKFTFMNTHYGFGENGQSKSSKLIYEYSKKITDNPTIVTGDFNMQPNTLSYKTMTEYFTDVNTATINLSTPTFHNYGDSKISRIIDYCFVNNKVAPVLYKVLTETFDGKYPSDHYGIYTTLKISDNNII